MLMAAVMLLSALPVNAAAFYRGTCAEGAGDKGTLTCTDETHHEHTAKCYKSVRHKHSKAAGCYRGIFLVCFKTTEKTLVCGCTEHTEDCYGSQEAVDVETILGQVDYDALSAEIKDMIAEKYGVEFDENWCEKNSALAEKYIRECMPRAKCITEEQRDAILDQIENEKEHAAKIVSCIRSKMHEQIVAAVSSAKNAVKEIISNRDLGLKIGKVITKLTGLNNAKASKKSALVQTALISAIRLSALSKEQKDAVIEHMKSGENGVKEIINWLWPVYTVRFVCDGAEIEVDTVEHGAMPSYDGETPERAADAQYTYSFSGWDKEFAAVTGDETYTAQFDATVNKYTVSFMAEDGETVLYSAELEYGAMPSYEGEELSKAEDDACTYAFAGWTPEIASVTGDAVYTAVFESTYKNFTVTFVNYNGAVISEKDDYHFGDTVTAPEAPVRAGYVFTGWDKEITAVAGDAVYKATYEISRIFADAYFFGRYNWNGEGGREIENWYHLGIGKFNTLVNDPASQVFDATLTTEDVDAPETMKTVKFDGTTYTFGADSGEDFYTTEWTRVVLEKGALSEFNNTGIRDGYTYHVDGILRLYHTVTFAAGDAEYSIAVEHGSVMDADAIVVPQKNGYEFGGWMLDGEEVDITDPVTESMTLTAKWTVRTYAEKPLKVNLGYAAVSASGSTKGNIHLHLKNKFAGKIYNVIVNEMAANYSKDTIIGSLDYENGDMYYGYAADGFDFDTMNFTGYSIADGILDSAVWNGITYYNATGIDTPDAGDYFRIYRTDFVACKAEYHMDNHARFYHTVTLDVDGTEYSIPVEHGKTLDAAAIAAPEKKGHTFAGWTLNGEDFDLENTSITESLTLTARWEVIKHEKKSMRVFVGYGKSATDETKDWFEIKTSAYVYNVSDCASFKNHPDSTAMTEGVDYTGYTASVGAITIGGINYANGTDVEGIVGDYYVVTEVILVSCEAEYHMDNHAVLYHTVTIVVDGVEYTFAVEHGAKLVLGEEFAGLSFVLEDGSEFDLDALINGSMTLRAVTAE